MELHKAAALYARHRSKLDDAQMRYDDVYRHVWRVKYESSPFESGYYLVIDSDIAPSSLLVTGADFEEENFITKQRGGTRFFKSLDAVASALQQIGQDAMPLDELPKPKGLSA